jgi:hypothetical protein
VAATAAPAVLAAATRVAAARFGDRTDRFPREDRGPRLGDAAFRAQRDAVEHAAGRNCASWPRRPTARP